MKLIALTLPYFFMEEHRILTALFDEGLETLHVRKPGTEPMFSERLLTLLPPKYREKVVVHDHFYLKHEFDLKGIHLSRRNPQPPAKYRGQLSISMHTPEELAQRKQYDYVFLSPIFDSISKADYPSAFTPQQLRDMASQRLIDKRVMALGGVDLDNIGRVRDYGFGGAVVMGALWQHFDRHNADGFKELITYFRKLKKAAG